MTLTHAHSARTVPATYDELQGKVGLRPIRSDAQLRRAMRIVDRLALLPKLTRDQRDYLEVLARLIEAYENEKLRESFSELGPLDLLRFIVAERGMSASDLGRLLGGPRQLGSAILRGQRQLSKAHIRRLAGEFSVDASLFLG